MFIPRKTESLLPDDYAENVTEGIFGLPKIDIESPSQPPETPEEAMYSSKTLSLQREFFRILDTNIDGTVIRRNQMRSFQIAMDFLRKKMNPFEMLCFLVDTFPAMHPENLFWQLNFHEREAVRKRTNQPLSTIHLLDRKYFWVWEEMEKFRLTKLKNSRALFDRKGISAHLDEDFRAFFLLPLQYDSFADPRNLNSSKRSKVTEIDFTPKDPRDLGMMRKANVAKSLHKTEIFIKEGNLQWISGYWQVIDEPELTEAMHKPATPSQAFSKTYSNKRPFKGRPKVCIVTYEYEGQIYTREYDEKEKFLHKP